MNVCIAATAEQQAELLRKHTADHIRIRWVSSTTNLLKADADFLIDCTFQGNVIPHTSTPLLIHAPALTLAQMQAEKQVARFCAWNTFLQRPVWEVAVADGADAAWLTSVAGELQWNVLLVKDEPGLVAPRIISHIINEAYCTWQTGVSTKEEIDVAMKLGTNYPFGPFDWCNQIGASNVMHLLRHLSVKELFINE